MSSYKGDFALGSTVELKFTTVTATGAPASMGGTPSLAAYPANSTTEITAGITLTPDFDARTGLNHVSVVASAGNGFVAGTDYELVLTAGTVDGVSVVGYKVGSFSIENRSALRPTVAGRTLDVAAGGEAGIDLGNINLPVGPVAPFGIITSGTLSGTHSETTADLGVNAPSFDIAGISSLLIVDKGFIRVVDSYDTGTRVATFESTTVSLADGDQWILFAVPQASTSNPIPANVKLVNDVTIIGDGSAGNKFRGNP